MRMIALAAVAAALAGCGPSAEEKQAAADRRAAGFVPPSVTSRLDYGSAQERRFRRLDRNGDDYIAQAELPEKGGGRLPGLDRNKDGRISLTEFSEGTMQRFDQMDLNHDGTVTSEERRTSGGRF
jgi:hypothetical protein